MPTTSFSRQQYEGDRVYFSAASKSVEDIQAEIKALEGKNRSKHKTWEDTLAGRETTILKSSKVAEKRKKKRTDDAKGASNKTDKNTG